MTIQDKKLREIAIEIPGATKLFRQVGLDYCCGGADSLALAAKLKGLDVADIVQQLQELHTQTENLAEQDWQQADFAAIIHYILTRFHQRHLEQLPELIFLAEKVEHVHGEREDCPVGVSHALKEILDELSQHMQKEEQVLFPMIMAQRYAMAQMPIQVMLMEHDAALDILQVIRSLTNDIIPPDDACTTWRVLYNGIALFEQDLIAHIALENENLFPRVLACI
ncbi:iron-sulfur cluster repair protein YtfE [Spirabiliibacterium falconis]|uniref:iron-sulfur cluster repair protein YtfE n=1 Tax=Spirabiliibacterium falconis TaxID=572023 RepID=UPI001AACA81D|nr:iron-sulfur cluster repair protein YtfE [Spirabiliibacterium falconis]MBE2894468.1 iron-sulfur cluster repair protein YtfE [Spirabiliibacterium falconis]